MKDDILKGFVRFTCPVCGKDSSAVPVKGRMRCIMCGARYVQDNKGVWRHNNEA